jgi:protein-S-isoprenylcysteine O-methyltransferase Ste14
MIQILLIFILFAFIHSITVSKKFKHVCKALFGETFMRVYYRALYNCVSVLTVGIALYFINQAPDRLLWAAPGWLRWFMHFIQLAGLAFGSLAFEHLDTGEFLGVKQIWRYFTRQEVAGNIEGLSQNELVTTGVYGIVRHPMYLAGIVIFTFNPHVTRNSLIVSILADIYFLFGSLIEERRFLRIFGDQYVQYRKRVPWLLPFTKKKTGQGKS